MVALSVLDLAPIAQGSTPADALRNSLALARHAEALGYRRYWLAEHHNMDGLACSATAVLIAHIAAGTSRIRVGAGGIMLPNHAPLVVAEQFGTLATLHPGRIDLGLGRAPGTDQQTMRALRQTRWADEDGFVDDVQELQAYLAPGDTLHGVRALPGRGTQVPIWILGSSLYGAQLAAHLGLPYAFASHFAPLQLLDALALYRQRFQPSTVRDKPHAMVGVNIVVADSDDEAAHLFTTLQQRFLGIMRGQRGPMQPPVPSMDGLWSEAERAQVERMIAVSAVGGPERVADQLRTLLTHTGADELIVTTNVFDQAARLRSYELLATRVKPLLSA